MATCWVLLGILVLGQAGALSPPQNSTTGIPESIEETIPRGIIMMLRLTDSLGLSLSDIYDLVKAGMTEYIRLRESLERFDKASDQMQLPSEALCSDAVLQQSRDIMWWVPIDGALYYIVNIAVFQDLGCTNGAAVLAEELQTRVLQNPPPQTVESRPGVRSNFCDEVTDCSTLGVNSTRETFSIESDLLFFYDAAAAFTFAALGRPQLASALLANTVEDLESETLKDVLRPLASWIIEMGLQLSNDCTNEHEKAAHNFISNIPIIGKLYDRVSSIVFLALGCKDLALERFLTGWTK